MVDTERLIILIIAILLVALFLFIGDKIFGKTKVELSGAYYLKAIITAVVIFGLIIGVNAILGEIEGALEIGIAGIAPILAFVVSIYAIRGLLMESADYERAAWVGVIAWTLVYITDYIAIEYLDVQNGLVNYI